MLEGVNLHELTEPPNQRNRSQERDDERDDVTIVKKTKYVV